MQASQVCYDFIKKNEGYSGRAYLDTGGVPTIGWGTTHYPNGHAVKMGDVCTEAEAQQYLEHEVGTDEVAVNGTVKVPLAQAEFDCLVDFAYNVGTGWITGIDHQQATLVKLLNKGNYNAVPGQLLLFERDIHGKVVPGLVNRRKWESQMWLSGENDHSHIVAATTQNAPGAMPQIVTPSVPKASDQTQEPLMATTVSSAVDTAGINVSTTTVVNTLLGNLTSMLVTIGAPIFAAMQGSTTSHYIAGALFGLAGLGSLITNTWNFISHNNAASSNTLQTINNLSQLAGQAASAIEPQVTPVSS